MDKTYYRMFWCLVIALAVSNCRSKQSKSGDDAPEEIEPQTEGPVGNETVPTTDLPDKKYITKFGGELPAGATEVSNSEFSRRWNAGEIRLDGPEAAKEAETQALKQDQIDRDEIARFETANPTAGRLLSPLSKPDTSGDVRPAGNGNYLFKLRDDKGAVVQEVETLGERYRLRAVARSVREFGTRNNQLGMYQELYVRVPEALRARLQMPALEEAEKLDVKALTELNNRIVGQRSLIVGQLPTPEPASIAQVCATHEGDGGGSDRVGNPGCEFNPYGLVTYKPWAGKQNITCAKNQGSRGSCVAFSVVSAAEYRISEKYGKHVNLSEQALYSKMKFNWPPAPEHIGDGSGTGFALAKGLAEKYPIPYENKWRYNPSLSRTYSFSEGEDGKLGTIDDVLTGYGKSCENYNETCSDSTHQSGYICTKVAGLGGYCGYIAPPVDSSNEGYQWAGASLSFWNPADRKKSVERVKLYLSMGYTILWSFDVEKSSFGLIPSMPGYVQFIKKGEDLQKGSHAVHVVGYVSWQDIYKDVPLDKMPAANYFIIKNSWGPCWGDRGFAYIPEESFEWYTVELSTVPSIL